MDASITRRGQPCWYRVDGVGMMAVNDALILEGAIFQMIRKHFRKEPFYVDLIDLMHEVRTITPLVTKSPLTRGHRFRIRQKWVNLLT